MTHPQIVKKHGHSIAITHMANKMMRIMWYMLKNNKNYIDGKPVTYHIESIRGSMGRRITIHQVSETGWQGSK